ncbi:MAG TPA: hypothetical protein VNU19_03825 [Candidatus Acidoferrum sp.]|nr:hypothetical protein [Candidatus Acidoferrum sp.]
MSEPEPPELLRQNVVVAYFRALVRLDPVALGAVTDITAREEALACAMFAASPEVTPEARAASVRANTFLLDHGLGDVPIPVAVGKLTPGERARYETLLRGYDDE